MSTTSSENTNTPKHKIEKLVTDIINDVTVSEGRRRAKIATIKAQVSNGTYDFSSQRVAEALIKKLF